MGICNGPGFPTPDQSHQRLPSHYTPLLLTNPKVTVCQRIVALSQMTHTLAVQKVKHVFTQLRQDILID